MSNLNALIPMLDNGFDGTDSALTHHPQLAMNLPTSFYEATRTSDQATEAIWHIAARKALLNSVNAEIILPRSVVNIIGDENVEELRSRLNTLTGEPVLRVLDRDVDSIRLIVDPRRHTFVNATGSAVELDSAVHNYLAEQISTSKDKGDAQGDLHRVPRPSNSFILYRQHHHREMTEKHRGLRNTEISRLIATQWHSENETVREHFRSLARQLKDEHAAAHPGYQYVPRRPGQKPRRRRTQMNTCVLDKIMGKDTSKISKRDWKTYTHKTVDLDNSVFSQLNDAKLTAGPNSITWAIPTLTDKRFREICEEQTMLQRICTLEPGCDGEGLDPGDDGIDCSIGIRINQGNNRDAIDQLLEQQIKVVSQPATINQPSVQLSNDDFDIDQFMENVTTFY